MNYRATAGVNLRKSPGTKRTDTVLIVMPKGTALVRDGIGKGWVRGKVTLGGKTYRGWASLDYMHLEQTPATPPALDTTPHLPRRISNAMRYLKYGLTQKAVAKRLVWINLFGHRVAMHSAVSGSFVGWEADVREWERVHQLKAWQPRVVQTFCWRLMRNSSSRSLHSWAIAADFDPTTNAQGSHNTDIPDYVRVLARHNGVTPGYDFKRVPDPMHFEYAG